MSISDQNKDGWAACKTTTTFFDGIYFKMFCMNQTNEITSISNNQLLAAASD